MTVHPFLDRITSRQAAVAGVLEEMCQALEPSWSQIQEAKTRYEAVGAWLAGATDLGLQRLSIYLQGSTALGTVVKPICGNEYDVDLVSHIPGYEQRGPAQIKMLIGDRLKENERYRKILVEKPRCWRLDYTNEFHLDVTPSIANLDCPNGGELVPDRKLRCWKPSNPKAYKALFERRAKLAPNLRVLKFDSATASADLEPYPDAPRFKSILCRIVQISKRHRDVYFTERDDEFAPISIILTTLAMRAYEHCVLRQEHDSELTLLIAVARSMPAFIEKEVYGGQVRWYVWNETTAGENFAERWNSDPRLPKAFFDWHARLLSDLEQLDDFEGIDHLGHALKDSFGAGPTERALASLETAVSRSRTERQLYVAPRIGLVAGAGAAALAGATAVKANTFFGTDPG